VARDLEGPPKRLPDSSVGHRNVPVGIPHEGHDGEREPSIGAATAEVQIGVARRAQALRSRG
jgi:hypothetical protein